MTVACALATLIVFPEGFLKSMGIAGAVVALVAAAAALTISPALLTIWGAKVARGVRRAPAAPAVLVPARERGHAPPGPSAR